MVCKERKKPQRFIFNNLYLENANHMVGTWNTYLNTVVKSLLRVRKRFCSRFPRRYLNSQKATTPAANVQKE